MAHYGHVSSGLVSESKYLFIDGGSLLSTWKQLGAKIYPGDLPELNWTKIVDGYDRVFYYDALPAQKHNESDADYEIRYEAKKRDHDKLKNLPNLHVREGVARFRRKRGNEQKGVDVLLAIEAYQQALQSNMDYADFILTDLDFYPLFDALVNTRVKTRLIYEIYATSEELIHSADQTQVLNGHSLVRWLSLTGSDASQRSGARISPIHGNLRDQGPSINLSDGSDTIPIYYWDHGEYCIFIDDANMLASYSLFLCLEKYEEVKGLNPGTLLRAFEAQHANYHFDKEEMVAMRSGS